jgi:hypothetical protein
MPSWIPEEPPVPPQHHAGGRLQLRYEDIAQDGHLVVEAMPCALGELWRGLDPERRRTLGGGRDVQPILSRVVCEAGEGPIAVHGPTEALGAAQLAHTVGPDGEIDRVVLNMWGSIASVIGRTVGPKPADAGRAVVAGRIFAEHVYTRPFGPPSERKVRALDGPDGPFVPEDRHVFRSAASTLTLPEGAQALDAELVVDATSTVFGLDHTDSNQHINSLVYPRLFIEAALRRLDALGRGRPALRAQAIELAYRKPSFAGERVRVLVRAFTAGDQPGVLAALVSEEDAAGPLAAARPRVFARVLFRG